MMRPNNRNLPMPSQVPEDSETPALPSRLSLLRTNRRGKSTDPSRGARMSTIRRQRQPFFALACIGDPREIDSEIQQVRDDLKMQMRWNLSMLQREDNLNETGDSGGVRPVPRRTTPGRTPRCKPTGAGPDATGHAPRDVAGHEPAAARGDREPRAGEGLLGVQPPDGRGVPPRRRHPGALSLRQAESGISEQSLALPLHPPRR